MVRSITVELSKDESAIDEPGTTISDLIAKRESNPRRAAALARARKKHASALADSPQFSLARLRLEKGLSQAKLAELMEVSQPYIAKIERGDDDIRASTIQRLAIALEVDAGVVLEAVSNGRHRSGVVHG